MSRRPTLWIALVVLSVGSAALALRLFPRAFPIVQLEITMDREAALASARAVMEREGLGPADYRQAASFASDTEAQTFVELEGGGKDMFARLLGEHLYSAYTWRVRQFREGEKRETLIRFRPDGQLYGFRELVPEDAPGPALDVEPARTLAETRARDAWQVDLTAYALVEQSQERRGTGRADHTFTYERSAPSLNDGRIRVRLVVTGDRLTEATHFIRVPEGFRRRYEAMRSANEAIGLFGSAAMVVLYVVGGIGIGLFWIMRHRFLVARAPIAWGIAVALLQLLASLSNWPLVWMSYDTAVPRTTFIGQQVVGLLAAFAGSAVLFSLSFMAAESLGRRAFGHHPQFWRSWSPGARASTTILGHTAVGYLLVSAFFAYDVLLYFYATRWFGWWTPSESLFNPDVLASYLPWLSAIANSLQAGFWEEALFRAVPIAGAALIGDRFGKRTLFIVMAFVVQTAVFGAGHAAYPTQPSYARPVELILPSIMFGLLYLAYGLLPGIVLHYAFDVVWFAIPLFVSQTSGIWIDRTMVIALTLVPLAVVLYGRWQRGAWVPLDETLRNRAWTPRDVPIVAAAEVPVAAAVPVTAGFVRAWGAVGLVGLGLWLGASIVQRRVPMPAASREDAARIAREALAARGVALGPEWRVMPLVDRGRSESHVFVWQRGGADRYDGLLGRYLTLPRWLVRVATFDGDVADRAEEWTVLILDDGQAGLTGHTTRVSHRVPESRPAASLTDAEARALALAAVETTLGVPQTALREVSAEPSKLTARTDWLFTFRDVTVPPIVVDQTTSAEGTDTAPAGGVDGEARVEVAIAGAEVVRVRPFVRVPEAWQRDRRGQATLVNIIGLLGVVLAAGTLVAGAGYGLVAWSRGHFSPRLFAGLFAVFAVVSVAMAANSWPVTLASLSTAQPFTLQVLMRIGGGVIGLVLTAAALGLAGGVLPGRLPVRRVMPLSTAALLGGGVGALAVAIASLRTSGEPQWPDTAGLDTYSPVVAAAFGSLPALLVRSVSLMVLLATVDHLTRGWTRWRALAGVGVIGAGVVLSGVSGDHVAAWLVGAVVSGVLLLCAYVWLFRHDVTLVPFAMAAAPVAAHLERAWTAGSPGGALGSLAGVLVSAAAAWGLCRAMRPRRAPPGTADGIS